MFNIEKFIKTGSIKKDCFKAKTNETLKEHTNLVVEVANNLLKTYPDKFSLHEKMLLCLACQVHDYGKVNEKFQEKINKNTKTNDGEIHHNFLSPLFLEFALLEKIFNKSEIRNLVTSIYYHHNREEENEDIIKYFNKYMKKNISSCFEKNMEISLSYDQYILFPYPNEGEDDFDWPSYAKLKGLLQKCDYAGSAGINVLEQFNFENRKRFLEKIETKWNLNSLQKFMKENRSKNVIVIAPTGMGKTEASFLWTDMDKAFYTLPLRVASNAIYERAKKTYEYQDVGLLHSDAFAFLNNSLQETQINIYEKYKITKQLGDSLTITTIDQLFKFPLKALGHELLFATLSYSKVIIDEIQMYSSTIIACIIVGLTYLVKEGGKFAITTATLPPIFLDLLKENGLKEEQYKIKAFLDFKFPKRHHIKLINNSFQYDLILKQATNNKVLVICNTVFKAQEVYRYFKSSNVRVNLLHSKFIKKDRQEKENEILLEAENGIWVTTQIVEASLDIDFDILHTDLSTADSLFQRMGRCYRKRNIDQVNPNVYIYNTKEGLKQKNSTGIYDADIYNLTWNYIQKYNDQILTEENKLEIINNIYNKEQLRNTDYLNEIKNKIESLKNCYPGKFDQKEVNDMFRDIHDITVIPEEIYEKNINEIIDLKDKYEESTGLEKINYQNELLKYTLQIPFYKLKNGTCNEFLKDKIYRVYYKYEKNEGLIYEEYNDQYN